MQEKIVQIKASLDFQFKLPKEMQSMRIEFLMNQKYEGYYRKVMPEIEALEYNFMHAQFITKFRVGVYGQSALQIMVIEMNHLALSFPNIKFLRIILPNYDLQLFRLQHKITEALQHITQLTYLQNLEIYFGSYLTREWQKIMEGVNTPLKPKMFLFIIEMPIVLHDEKQVVNPDLVPLFVSRNNLGSSYIELNQLEECSKIKQWKCYFLRNYLRNDQLMSIDLLNKIKNIRFSCLKILGLSESCIFSIQPFSRIDLPELSWLMLRYNFITSLISFRKINAKYLRNVSLDVNKISQASSIVEGYFSNILKLDLNISGNFKNYPLNNECFIMKLEQQKQMRIRNDFANKLKNEVFQVKALKKGITF